MGQCGRNKTTGSYEGVYDVLHIMMTLHDFVYLNERLFYDKCGNGDEESESEQNTNNTSDSRTVIISIEEEQKMIQKQLVDCVRF